jgi:type III secretion protein T
MELPDIHPLLHMGLLLTLSMARLGAFFTACTVFGSEAMPWQVRNCLVLMLGLLVMPITMAQAPADLTFGIKLLGLMGKEILVGYLLAYAFNIVFWIPEGAGFVMDSQRGASQAGQEDPLSGSNTSPLGSLLFQCAVMIFIASGAFITLIAFFMTSYVSWPLFSFFPDFGPRGIHAVIGQFALLAAAVVTLAGPVLIVCFLTDFGLGLVNRFAPQLNVFFLAMPIKSACVLFVLIAYAAVLLSALSGRIMDLDWIWNTLLQTLA